jgi:membrane fusion protein (multidrug efflux system)
MRWEHLNTYTRSLHADLFSRRERSLAENLITLDWRMSMIALPFENAGTNRFRFAQLAVLAGMLLPGIGLLSGCGKSVSASTSAPPPPMKVKVIKAEQTDVPLTGEWVGTLDGYVNAQIQPQANGYLIRQDYREGSEVEKGQVLFEIDPRPFQAALEEAQGTLGQAQAQLALAEINVNRDTPLAAEHAIAKSQLDNDTQQKAQAEATVRSAEATVANAELNLGFTKVRSLITGVAGQATIQVGNLVNAQSVLTSVSQLDPIKVYFSVSDSEYLALTKRAGAGGAD